MREQVMTEPKELVRIEMKNAGFDLDSLQVPKRVYLLADSIYDAMIKKECGEYKYTLFGTLMESKSKPAFFNSILTNSFGSVITRSLIFFSSQKVHLNLFLYSVFS